MLPNNIICLFFQPVATIDNLTRFRWRMIRRKQAESNKQPPTHMETTNKPIPNIQLLDNYGGDDRVRYLFL